MEKTSQDLYKFLNNTNDNNINNHWDSSKRNASDEFNISPPSKKEKSEAQHPAWKTYFERNKEHVRDINQSYYEKNKDNIQIITRHIINKTKKIYKIIMRNIRITY